MPNNYQIRYRGINAHFRAAQWDQLNFEERWAVCQRLENCLAAERNTAPRQIVSIKMDGKTFGYQSGNRIFINEHILEHNAFMTEDGYVQIPACGWQVYDTVCHEDLHGMMEDMKSGQTFTYISPERNYDLYRIQWDEKYAFAVGQDRTLSAILDQKEIHGLEPDMIEYKNAVKEDRYQDRVAQAEDTFGIRNIDKELDQLLYDKERGITPTDPSTGYMKLDNMLYDAQHPIEEEFEGEEEGEGSASPIGAQQASLSYNNLFEESSDHESQEASQSLSYNQWTQSTTEGDYESETESVGMHR